MMHTHLRDELELLERIGALDTEASCVEANARGHAATFIGRCGSRAISHEPLQQALRPIEREPRYGARMEILDGPLDRLLRLGLDLPRDQDHGPDVAGALSAGPGSCSPGSSAR